jgi:hypothetical protein
MFVCVGVTGCATILQGTTEKLTVSTNPSGALVSDGKHSVCSPGVLELTRKTDHILTISKPGYETATVSIRHVFSSPVLAHVLLGGFIGFGVDTISGARWELVPKTVAVVLRPLFLWEKEGKTSAVAISASDVPLSVN